MLKSEDARSIRVKFSSHEQCCDSIKSIGISEDEISTSRFNIHPVYGRYNEQTGESPLIGYRVTNTISVETTNLNAAADIIDNGVAAGANRVDSVYFTLSPDKQIQVKDGLIADAVLNAKTKAENALTPLNHKIIGVSSNAFRIWNTTTNANVLW